MRMDVKMGEGDLTLRMFTFDMVKNFGQILIVICSVPQNDKAFCLSNEKLKEEGDGSQCKVHACSCLKSAWILPYKFRVL